MSASAYPAPSPQRGSRLVGTFGSLVAEMVARRGVPSDQAEAAARAFVEECGCQTITVNREGRRVELIVFDEAKISVDGTI